MSVPGQQQQKNAWAKGPEPARGSQHSTRPNTASPNQPNPSQPPTKNVWQARSAANNKTNTNTSNGQQQQRSDTPTSNVDRTLHKSVNGFNTAEVRAFLARGTTSSGGAAHAGGSKMASGQPFFQTLAKQMAAFEAGG